MYIYIYIIYFFIALCCGVLFHVRCTKTDLRFELNVPCAPK